jgi:hypothetical protein
MPHGQWVAFEGDQQHKCDERPTGRATPSAKPNNLRPAETPAEPFMALYPKVPESPTAIPSPARPQPTPRPGPQPAPRRDGSKLPTHIGSAPIPRLTSASQLAATHKPSRPGAILALLTALLSSTVGLTFGAFALLSLPLNVVAGMHLTGWSWFSAIIGVVMFSCIPFVGQLGYLILATMGAYYLWTANFDWQQAAYPSAQTFSVSMLSESELERFKANVVRRGFEQACKSDALKTDGFDGKLPARVASQCECFATNFASKLTRDDLIAFDKSGRYPDELQQRLGTELRRACQN